MLADFTIISMFLVTVFVVGAALRDFEAGTAELLFATPLSRRAYLGGRFSRPGISPQSGYSCSWPWAS